MTTGLVLGRPGVYNVPQRDDTPLHVVRLDIAGFVGVALRGPVDTPVLVSSWSDFVSRFGGLERADGSPDRLLPYAVQAFFAQGGTRAYVVRVAPPPGFSPSAEEATAILAFDPEDRSRWLLAAANEGTWGDSLTVRLEFEVASTFQARVVDDTSLLLPTGAEPADQSLVRVRRPDLPVTGELRVLTRLADPRSRDRLVTFDAPIAPLAQPHDDAGDTVDVDVITGTLIVVDTSSNVHREERLSGLGLAPGHPRFIAADLAQRSLLVRAAGDWSTAIQPDRFLRPRQARRRTGGVDRNYGITFDSFFDDLEPIDQPNDVLDQLDVHRGVDAIARVSELGLLCVPDLTWRSNRFEALPAPARRRAPGPCDGCARPDDEPELASPTPIPVGLDARAPADLAEIVRRQRRLVDTATHWRRFVALLDVPAGLPVRRIGEWRASFDSSYAAAYHPWLGVVRPATDGGLAASVPPSSFAAGIIAARERRLGLPWGPANELAVGAVLSAEPITDAVHDQLHLIGINVYRAERDGFRLSAARTLSSDPDFRQLSVRRLMTMLRLTLERQTQWLVFEPNTFELRARLLHTVTQFLRGLQRRGAFAGRTEQESFFVTCDGGLNSFESQREGRLIAEIGVAPASPLEYVLVRISQDVDGSLAIGEVGG